MRVAAAGPRFRWAAAGQQTVRSPQQVRVLQGQQTRMAARAARRWRSAQAAASQVQPKQQPQVRRWQGGAAARAFRCPHAARPHYTESGFPQPQGNRQPVSGRPASLQPSVYPVRWRGQGPSPKTPCSPCHRSEGRWGPAMQSSNRRPRSLPGPVPPPNASHAQPDASRYSSCHQPHAPKSRLQPCPTQIETREKPRAQAPFHIQGCAAPSKHHAQVKP